MELYGESDDGLGEVEYVTSEGKRRDEEDSGGKREEEEEQPEEKVEEGGMLSRSPR